MTRFKLGPQTIVSAVLAILLFSSVAWQNALAQVASRPAQAPPDQPATVLSPTLSYYFISGNTFTALAGLTFYVRQVTGCVNQTQRNTSFSAPVHLPQGSQVVALTLFTYDNVLTTTFSTAQFFENDGQGGNFGTLAASSAPQVIGYQHHDNTIPNPTTIDNQNYAYQVDWYETGVDADSPQLSLCGVRLAYYVPVGATFLPTIER